MKPSALAQCLSLIVAEECGCPSAWDMGKDGPILEVTDLQMKAIRLRVVDLLWPTATTTNPRGGAQLKCEISNCASSADFFDKGKALCRWHKNNAFAGGI